jgi:hypothetical protein
MLLGYGSNNVDSWASVFVSLLAGDCLTDNSLFWLSTFDTRVISSHYLQLIGSHWPPTTATATGYSNSLYSLKSGRIKQIVYCFSVYSLSWKVVYLVVTKQWHSSSVTMSQYVSQGKLVKSNTVTCTPFSGNILRTLTAMLNQWDYNCQLAQINSTSFKCLMTSVAQRDKLCVAYQYTMLTALCYKREFFYVICLKKLNSVACSPQANYTDRAAAACRRSRV